MNRIKWIFYLTLILISISVSYAQDKGFKEEQLTDNAFDNQYPSYNKTGDRIIFESNRDGHWQVYIMTINGKGQQRLIRSSSNDRRPTWHPFKNMILFESDRSGFRELYTYDLDSRSLDKVPIPLGGNKSFSQFAPNGTELVFNQKVSDDNYNVYICTTKGKYLKKVLDNAYANLYPRFTPRGDAIAYYSGKSTKNENNEIYVYNIILKEEVRLTETPSDDLWASWSNTGNRIVFTSTIENGTSEIYIMTKFGKSVNRITFNDYDDIHPNWSPNDINLLISSKKNGNYQICKILLKEEL